MLNPLDGMSDPLHADPATRERDRRLREELRNEDFEVIEITYNQLSDRGAMARVFFRLSRMLMGRDRAAALRDDPSWFDDQESTTSSDSGQ